MLAESSRDGSLLDLQDGSLLDFQDGSLHSHLCHLMQLLVAVSSNL